MKAGTTKAVPTSVPSSRLELGTRIKVVADSFGSRKNAAEALSVSTDQLARYIRGEGEPDILSAAEFCRRAKCSLMWLAYGAEEPSHHVAEERAEYISVPLYNGVRAAAGGGAVIEHEAPDDALIFKEEWIRFELGARPQDLYLIRVSGDSMEPTLRSGDTILVDRRATRPDREGVYILRMNEMLLVKRLQALPGGIVKVTSDNQAFATFDVKLADIEGGDLSIVGRVVWAGRRL